MFLNSDLPNNRGLRRDNILCNLGTNVSTRIPVGFLAGQPIRPAGSMFYNLTDTSVYYSNGIAWIKLINTVAAAGPCIEDADTDTSVCVDDGGDNDTVVMTTAGVVRGSLFPNGAFFTGAGTALGTNSHAEGTGTTAIGTNSHAEGSTTTAIATASHSEGASTTATGTNSHAEGSTTRAVGANSHAEGALTRAVSDRSHAEGSSCTSTGLQSHSEGLGCTAIGESSHSEGSSTTAVGAQSHSEGLGSRSTGASSHAEDNACE